jgi:hypothetical protein
MSKFAGLKIVDFTQKDYNDKLIKYYDEDGRPGLELGFATLNQFYSHKHSGVTDWTGKSSMGKTYFVLEILMQLTEKYGQRHALYVPDLGTYYETFAKLVKMYTGKDFETKYHNKISIGELLNKIPQISNDFKILIKDDYRKPIAPQTFWEFVADYKDDFGKLHTGTIDSWKNMSKDFANLREDQYLDMVLSYRNEIAEDGNVHFHTIAHPNKTELDGNSEDKGKRRVPTAQDIKGGDAWHANGKNLITIDWPNIDSNMIDVHVWKTKPENVGKKGKVISQIGLDLKKGRYYEMINGHRMYAFDHLTQDYSIDNYLSPREQQKISTQQGIKNMSAATNAEKSQIITKEDLPIQNPFEDFSNPPF